MTDVKDFSSDSPDRPKHIAFRTDHTYDNDEVIEDLPENTVMENVASYTMRPRAMSHHLSSTKVPSRKWLTVQARFWRACMALGMRFHGFPSPKPPKPSFIHNIKTDTIPIKLYFYVPSGYHATFRDRPEHRYPVVVNFHGGGFCLGTPTDDRYYARVILAHTSAIFVSVGYRKAPEHPFPIPVDDSVEALLYLATHAEDYRIDASKIALTGFSAGANLSLTVPFRLAFHTDKANPRKYATADSEPSSPESSPSVSRKNSIKNLAIPKIVTTSETKDTADSKESSPSLHHKAPGAGSSSSPFLRMATTHTAAMADLSRTTTNNDSLHSTNPDSLRVPTGASSRPTLIQAHSSSRITKLLTPSLPHMRAMDSVPSSSSSSNGYDALKILTIVSWYPLLDWTSSRSSKRRSAVNPAKTLNPLFTDLFDYSYLPPPDNEGNHVSPFASPGLAPDQMLRDGLPQRIQLWLCEYDMLLQEGKRFSDRLHQLGKTVIMTLIDGVPHGWDKSPNPFRDQSKIDRLYVQAARQLEQVFDEARHAPRSVAGERIGLGGRL